MNENENTPTLHDLLRTPLTTPAEAEKWVRNMHAIDYGCHPDDSGDQIIHNPTGERVFDDLQAALYDLRMDEAHDLLPDVYETSLAAFHEYYGDPS